MSTTNREDRDTGIGLSGSDAGAGGGSIPEAIEEQAEREHPKAGYDPRRPLSSLFGTFFRVMARPERFFTALGEETECGAGRAVAYLVVLVLSQIIALFCLSAMMLSLLGAGGPESLDAPGPGSVYGGLAITAVLVAVGAASAAVLAVYALAAVMHLWLVAASWLAARLRSGGATASTGDAARRSYGRTLAVASYSLSPFALWFVPVLNALFAIYSLYLLYQGLAFSKNASRAAATGAIVLLLTIAFVVVSLLASVLTSPALASVSPA